MHASHRRFMSADAGAAFLGGFIPSEQQRFAVLCGCLTLCGCVALTSELASAQPAPWTMETESERGPATGGYVTPPAIPAPAMPAPAAPPRALLRGEEPAFTELPNNVILFTYHRELVSRMLQQSPTFKRQCARIAKASIRLSVELREAPPGTTQGARAQTLITNERGGTARAQVFLNSDHRSSSVELIAHEFEHILEWLDGVDYDRGERSGQVRGSISGALETRRAIAVGQQVAREMRVDREPHAARDTTAGPGPM